MSAEACEYSGKANFILANDILIDKENDRALCIPGNYSPENFFDANENMSINDVQRDFILAAEKHIQNLDLINRKEKELLIKIKKTLPQEAKYAVHKVKTSMQNMHEKYAKQLDTKLNELTSVLTRVEHLHEDMQDFKQWEQTDEESLTNIESFLQASIRKKEMIESMIEESMNALNQKRQKDEILFAEFSKSINLKVKQSIEGLERCLHNAEMRRKTRVDAKISKLKVALQDLKNFG